MLVLPEQRAQGLKRTFLWPECTIRVHVGFTFPIIKKHYSTIKLLA